jgi:hypothetical protein
LYFFIVRKTTSKQEHTILTTLYLAGAKNTDSWCAGYGDLQHSSPLDVLMVPSPKVLFITSDNNPIGVDLALGSTIQFGGLKFIADRFGHPSISPRVGTQVPCL